MNRKNVLVLFGGCSPEHEISIESAATVVSGISEDKYNVIPVYITREGKWLLYDGFIDDIKSIQWEKFGTEAVISPDRVNKGLLRIVGDKVKNIPVDLAIPVLHGRYGEDGGIQGLLELSGIPYVGCGVLSSALCMDKHFTKLIVKSLGIAQAPYISLHIGELADLDAITAKMRYKIGYPCFVKPANAGSSVGITKVTGKRKLREALELASDYDSRIIIEKAVIGRELECGVLGCTGDALASVVGEIIPGAEFYDYDAKYNSAESQTVVPADISQETAEEIQRMSVEIFNAMDCNGLARVDFFLEEGTGKIIFNEINTMPGFTGISMYPMLWKAAGVPLGELIDRLIDMAQ